MKKSIAIPLLLVFLSANTELHQLLKLPVLIHHFFEHHKQEPSESFAEFISEHYITHLDYSDKDHHDHDNLPFKSNDCATAHVSSIACVNQIQFSIATPKYFENKVSPIFNGAIYSSAFHSSIWQPPKIS